MKTNLHIRIMAIGLFIFLFAGNNFTAQTNWVKHMDNPIFEGYTDGPNSTGSPVVIHDEGIYKMWFSGSGNSFVDDQIFYAESTDGIDWEHADEPVISSGETGDWNREKMPGSVIRVGDTLMMWYSGSSDQFDHDVSIGYAKRHVNDAEWDILLDPVLEKGEPGTWEETGVFYPVVYFDGLEYHMWYHGYEGSSVFDPSREGYATSDDGIDWTKCVVNPVIELGDGGSFYDTWFIGTSVLFYNDEYHLYFTGWDGNSTSPWKYFRTGLATSEDGIEWTVQNGDSAVLDVGEDGAWDDRYARYCSVLFHENAFKMWYSGRGTVGKIGYAVDYIIPGISDLNSGLTKQIIVYPNPSKDDVKLTYHLSIRSKVSLEIYDQFGQLISVLVDETKHVGEHEVIFESMELPSGVYFCVLKANNEIQTAKIVKL